MAQKVPKMRSRWTPGGDSGAKVVFEGLRQCSWDRFWVDLGSISGSFWNPKSIHLGIDFMIICVMCFLLLLERFGLDFGALLYPKSEQKWKEGNVEIVVLCK